MYGKEVNKRSPLHVFERSIHGGLGPGNLGVVMSRAGTGKTPFLVAIALDDLMRDRKVLHVNTRDAAEKVRGYYEEIFRAIAGSGQYENPMEMFHRIERNRRIHSFLNGTFSLKKLMTALEYMSAHADFKPSTLILDGYPSWTRAEESDLATVRDLAKTYECEVWITGVAHRDGEDRDERGVPARIARFDSFLSVIVRLEHEGDHIRLRIVKDHENPNPSELQLKLDPNSFLVRW